MNTLHRKRKLTLALLLSTFTFFTVLSYSSLTGCNFVDNITSEYKSDAPDEAAIRTISILKLGIAPTIRTIKNLAQVNAISFEKADDLINNNLRKANGILNDANKLAHGIEVDNFTSVDTAIEEAVKLLDSVASVLEDNQY